MAAPKLRVVHSADPAIEPVIDDAELIARMSAADEDAAVAFHDRARPVIDRTIARLLGHGHSDHEDLVQLSLIELVSSVARFRGETSLEGFIGRVTAHVVFHHLRRRKLERRIFDAAANVDLIGTALSSPARTARARTLLARVRRHLEEMETNKAWTFVLHDVLGFDLREIAQITEVSVAAAQRRLVRGRTELHERIAEDPELAGSLTELEGDR
ncbi:MAG: RNA polymerase sigma factor [Polyangiales bacterium]